MNFLILFAFFSIKLFPFLLHKMDVVFHFIFVFLHSNFPCSTILTKVLMNLCPYYNYCCRLVLQPLTFPKFKSSFTLFPASLLKTAFHIVSLLWLTSSGCAHCATLGAILTFLVDSPLTCCKLPFHQSPSSDLLNQKVLNGLI